MWQVRFPTGSWQAVLVEAQALLLSFIRYKKTSEGVDAGGIPACKNLAQDPCSTSLYPRLAGPPACLAQLIHPLSYAPPEYTHTHNTLSLLNLRAWHE